MPGKYKTLFNNTVIFAIGTIGSRLITFLLVPLYTNVLSTSQYGTADLVLSLSYLIIPVVSLVFQDAVLRFGLSKNVDLEKVASSTIAVLFIASMVAIVLTPLYSLYPAISEWRWYLTIIVITGCFNNCLYSYAKAKDYNKLYSLCSILNALVLGAFNCLLLLAFDLGVKGFLIANIIANIIPGLILLFFTHLIGDMKGATFDFSTMAEMLKFSAPLVLSNISWWFVNSSDRVMIEHFLSSSHLGLYTAASKIPSLLTVFTSIFSSAWIISSIREYESDKDSVFYERIFCYFSLCMCVGASIIITIIKPFMSIYVGAEFYSSWKLAPVLVVGAVFFAFASFFGAIYGAAKKNILVTISTLLGALVNIFINFILIPHIGVIGASISTAVGYGTIAIFRMFNSQKFMSFNIDYFRLIISCLLVIAQATIVTMIENTTYYSLIFLFLLIFVNLSSIKQIKSFVISFKNNRGSLL